MSHYRLTKFEIAKSIGLRIEQLSMGAKTKLQYDANDTPDSMAWKELLEGRMPYVIERTNVETNEKIYIPISEITLTTEQRANAIRVIERLHKDFINRNSFIFSNVLL